MHPLIWDREFNKADWAEEFPGRDPVRVTFDFKRAFTPSRVKAFVSGKLGGMTVETSPDGKLWQPAGRLAGMTTWHKEVLSREVELTPKRAARYVRLQFHERAGDRSILTVPEIEIWAVARN